MRGYDYSDIGSEEDGNDPTYDPNMHSDEYESEFESDPLIEPSAKVAHESQPISDEGTLNNEKNYGIPKTYGQQDMSEEEPQPPLCHRHIEDGQFIRDTEYAEVYIKAYCPTKVTKLGISKKHMRPYDTPHACKYCGQLMTNIHDHLSKKHREHAQVNEIEKLRETIKRERDENARSNLSRRLKVLLDLIRNDGDHLHNNAVSE